METAQYTEQNETYRLRNDSLKKTNLFFFCVCKPKGKLPTLFPTEKEEKKQRDKDKGKANVEEVKENKKMAKGQRYQAKVLENLYIKT